MITTPRVAIVMPAKDEEEALPLVLRDLPREHLSHVVVVDNGSKDQTATFARAAGAVVISEPRRGYGQACQAGVAYVSGAAPDSLDPPLGDLDIITFLDADYSDHPEDLSSILAPILADRADLVLGSRVLGGAGLRALLPQAWFGNRFACLLMRLLFGARYTDLGPFRAIRVGVLRDLAMRDRGFGWTVEMQLKARAYGLRVLEVPVRYRPRTGKSKITGTFAGTLRAGLKIVGWILVWRIRLLYRPVGRPKVP